MRILNYDSHCVFRIILVGKLWFERLYLYILFKITQPCGRLLGKGQPLCSLVCDVFCVFVTFPCVALGQVWHLIVSIPDLCLLSYFNLLHEDYDTITGVQILSKYIHTRKADAYIYNPRVFCNTPRYVVQSNCASRFAVVRHL